MKYNVSYFKYNSRGEETIKSELSITKKRLLALLETHGFKLDVFCVEDETGKVLLDNSDNQYNLAELLKGSDKP